MVGYIYQYQFKPIAETTLPSRMVTIDSTEAGAGQNSTISTSFKAETAGNGNSTFIAKNIGSTDDLEIFDYEWSIPDDYNEFVEA